MPCRCIVQSKHQREVVHCAVITRSRQLLPYPGGAYFLLSQRVPPELQLAYQSLGSAAAIRESFWCVNSFFWGWTVLRFARLVALTTQPRADVLFTSGL